MRCMFLGMTAEVNEYEVRFHRIFLKLSIFEVLVSPRVSISRMFETPGRVKRLDGL